MTKMLMAAHAQAPSTAAGGETFGVGRLPIGADASEAIASVGWLDLDGGVGVQNIHLPSDLYIVSLRCDGLDGPGSGIVAVVYSVRDTLRPFVLTGRRQAVVAALTPLGMLQIFGFPGADVVDRPIPLEALCGDVAAMRLASAMRGAKALQERARLFGAWLEQRATGARRVSIGAKRVAHAASVWAGNPTGRSIQELACDLGVTARQIERDFQATMRVSPSTFRRIVKFQRAAADVSRGRRLLEVAADHEFADQAHMTNVFRQFAALSPRKLAVVAADATLRQVRQGLAERIFLLDVPRAAGDCDATRYATEE